VCGKYIRVVSFQWTASRDLWSESAPLTRPLINKIASIQLTTLGKHQGWTTHPQQGSWSWFELAVLKPVPLPDSPPEYTETPYSDPDTDWTEDEPANLGEGRLGFGLADRIKRRDSGSMLTWESHRIRVNARGEESMTGMRFGSDHELFDHVEEGDSIGVLCCAQRRYWECVGINSVLKFEAFFEPVLDSSFY